MEEKVFHPCLSNLYIYVDYIHGICENIYICTCACTLGLMWAFLNERPIWPTKLRNVSFPSCTARTFRTWIHLLAGDAEIPMTQYFFRQVLFVHHFGSLFGQTRHTGPIVFCTDMNAYLTVLFVCNSGWVMTMKSDTGWQSSEVSCGNSVIKKQIIKCFS